MKVLNKLYSLNINGTKQIAILGIKYTSLFVISVIDWNNSI